jgi:hypothetical protein
MSSGNISLTEQEAKDLLHRKGRTRLEVLLLLMVVDGTAPKSVSTLQALGSRCGKREVKKWNVSDTLRKGNGTSILTDGGWELTSTGMQIVATLSGQRLSGSVAQRAASDIRQHLPKIASMDARNFVEEAVKCFESGLLRPAVVFSWVGAVAILQNLVVTKHIAAFNSEAKRRDPKWKDAKTADDLGRMKEHDLLDILETLSVLGKNVKQVLQNQGLNLRNACGHPNSLAITENVVAAHLDILILNVYSKF